MNEKVILILKMGGAIEGYNINDPDANDKDRYIIDEYFKTSIKPHFRYRIESVVEKDSRQITEKDREKLLYAIKTAPECNILIPHGTYTMIETAQYLQQNMVANVKRILLTGSMTPLEEANSDAGFNLGFAIGALSVLKTGGIYVCMHGRVFKKLDHIVKDKKALRFVEGDADARIV
ncbi:MAG: asparaginase [Bifidobacteriaceae bacterium]|jgi:L-asparaginase|nr:asparaginase [Bifidobacteriaceae bacterium]